MTAIFQLVHFLVLSCEVLRIANGQNQEGMEMPLPPPDSKTMQDHQQALADEKAAAGPAHPVPQNVVTNSGGVGGGVGIGIGVGMGGGMDGGIGGVMGGGMGDGMSGGMDGGMVGGMGGGMTGGMGSGIDGGMGWGALAGSGLPSGGGGWGAMAGSSIKAPENVKYCYAQGPLLPESLLPKPKYDASLVDVGAVSCEEVVGYLMGLGRFYDRKCSRMGNNCPSKYMYAVSWYNTVAKQKMTQCNIAAL